MKVIAQTRRLLLREMGPGDLAFMAEMLGDPEVMRFYPKPMSQEEAKAWVDRQAERYATFGFGWWLCVRKADSVPVGQAGLVLHSLGAAEVPGLGYMIHRPHHRQGYAGEAVTAVIDFCRNVLGREDVVAAIRPENAPSQAFARSLGMEDDGRRAVLVEIDHVLFSFPAARTRPGTSSC